MLASELTESKMLKSLVACLATLVFALPSAKSQVIVPAGDANRSPETPTIVGTGANARQILLDARSAMGVRNYGLANQLIEQASRFPGADNLAYSPAMAREELKVWMQQDGKKLPAESAACISDTCLPASGQTVDADTLKQTLLKARQAIALGDTALAQQLVQPIGSMTDATTDMGDSVKTIHAMIARQSELAQLAQQNDATYNQSAATFLLAQAESLIQYQDFETAQTLVDQARKFPADFAGSHSSPDAVDARLAEAKATASNKLDQKKSNVASLMAQAQLAIDQEKWQQADQLISQATALNLPASNYGADDVQPWQLKLQVNQALARLGKDTSGAVVQASASQTAWGNDSNSAVVQADYDPAADTTRNVTVAADASDEGTELKFANESEVPPIPSRGLELYKSGMEALGNADRDKAEEYFRKAWQFEDQLDPNVRQSIQNKLSHLAGQKVSAAATAGERVADASQSIDLDDVRSEQQATFRRLQSEVLKDRASAEQMLEENPREALERMSMLRNRISQSNLDPDSQRPLLVAVDRDIRKMQEYVEDNLTQIENAERNAERKQEVERRADRRVEDEKQMQNLVEQYNQLIDQERYAEAMAIVRQAKELAPDSEIAAVLDEKSKFQIRERRLQEIRDMKEQGVYNYLEDTSEDMVFGDPDMPLTFDDPELFGRNTKRRRNAAAAREYASESERRIWNVLKNEQVQGEFRGTLAEAIDQLSIQAGINIVFDDTALRAEGVEKDALVDVTLHNPISLDSALDIILKSHNLTRVVNDSFVRVTSRMAQQSNLVYKTYYIGDLIMSTSSTDNPMRMNFMQPSGPVTAGGVMNVSANMPVGGAGNGGSMSPVAMGQQIGGQLPNIPFGGGFNGFNYGGGYPQSGTPAFSSMGGRQLGGVTEADFQQLIDLIQQTVQTDSWQETGQGLGTIQAFTPNLSLIVSQTQEIQDEIQDLLKKLRELNDVQIVIEVRFMTLQDNFFERIGVDFDFRLNDNSNGNVTLDPITGNITPDNVQKSSVIGFNPNGTAFGSPTADLDIPFIQDSFNDAVPTFGGFNAASAANFGFAILSDIEVFFLVQATKGNERSNVMQAPTVTMFNGQSASISDGSQRPFVTSVTPVVGDFAVGQQPIITLIPDGTNLSVQAVVSDDRRFVRLNLSPFFSQITSVETFTFSGEETTEISTNSVLDDLLDLVNGGANADDSDDELQTRRSGVTVQQPVVAFTTVNTVVSVPDGGTVLMGGIKTMSEARSENGIPMLSNIPYINRLFKNVGIGQQTSNLMMMVTPRILIQEELEEDQVGIIDN